MTVVPPSRGPLGKINGFQLLKFLGKGTFGAVYQARREADGKIYAIKKVDTRKMTAKERAEAVNEIRVLASVAGEHVITFYEAFVEQDVLYIVTEFAMNGDLLQLLKNKRRAGHLPEATVWSYFIQMCLGVKTMHDNNILHRDLKAANVRAERRRGRCRPPSRGGVRHLVITQLSPHPSSALRLSLCRCRCSCARRRI